MKKILLIIAVFALLSNPIYSQKKDFGLGIILGEPTGLSAKL